MVVHPASKTAAIVEVADLVVSFSGFKALNGMTCRFKPGCVNGLIGPNGAGKSTLLNALSGFAPTESGSIAMSGLELTGCSPEVVSSYGVARSFQVPRLHKSLSALDNIVVALPKESPRFGLWCPWLPSPPLRAARRQALEILNAFGSPHLLSATVRDLTLPEQRIIEFARALAKQPRVILLDEPSSGLGVDEGGQLLAQGLKMLPEGATVIVVSHDVDIVFRMSSWVVAMLEGRTLAQGTPDEIRVNSDVRRAYLGNAL
jgi:branched-chain amino acid transport system ATP-binding protein